jgi:hypothetical protein
MSTYTADRQDEAIVAERMRNLNKQEGPRVGDWVTFADGTLRRISYDWGDGVQTSDYGSFHLGEYGVSFSGGLYGTVPTDSLTLTQISRPGDVWIFHHDMAGAGRGVHFQPEFRVYSCNLPAPN